MKKLLVEENMKSLFLLPSLQLVKQFIITIDPETLQDLGPSHLNSEIPLMQLLLMRSLHRDCESVNTVIIEDNPEKSEIIVVLFRTLTKLQCAASVHSSKIAPHSHNQPINLYINQQLSANEFNNPL